jgi:hypothetical protein
LILRVDTLDAERDGFRLETEFDGVGFALLGCETEDISKGSLTGFVIPSGVSVSTKSFLIGLGDVPVIVAKDDGGELAREVKAEVVGGGIVAAVAGWVLVP